jgi:hypothetical protein
MEHADAPVSLLNHGKLGSYFFSSDDTLKLVPATREPHRNPTVAMDDWPDPLSDRWLRPVGDDPPESEVLDIGDEPIHSLDRDPEYTERTELPSPGPIDEPTLTDEEIIQLLEAQLGDLANEKLIDTCESFACTPNFTDLSWGADASTLSKKDHSTLRFLATDLHTHFPCSTYEDLCHGVCEELDLHSEFVAWRHLDILSGLERGAYDCCVNSCCCFIGRYKDPQSCLYSG